MSIEESKIDADIAVDEVNKVNSDSSDETPKLNLRNYNIPFSKKKELFFSKKPPPPQPKEPFFFWYTKDQSTYERKVVFKLDCVILSYVCLSFFMKYLDINNISNAYVSGMKEDFHMKENDYNIITSMSSLVYALVGLPLSLLITKVKPHILLPACEMLWAFMTLIGIATVNYQGILAVRIIQGAIEGISYPSINYILGCWYTKQELTKRTAIFCVSGTLGTMFGGYIQSGIYSALEGKGSLPSWKWAFVIDALITLPVGVMGYFLLPDTPSDLRTNFIFSEEELKFCQKRVALDQDHVEEVNKLDWSAIKHGLTSWQLYIFPLAYAMDQIGEYVSGYWGVALKADGYSVYQANNYPTIASGVSILVCLSASVWCDYWGSFWEVYTAVNLLWCFSFSIIVAWDVPAGLKFFAFCISKLNDTTAAIICSWANNVLREDRQLRAFVLGALNICYCIFYTAIPLTVWNTKYAPRYKSAHIVSLVLQCISTCFTVVIIYFERYHRRKIAFIEEELKGSGKIVYEDEKASKA